MSEPCKLIEIDGMFRCERHQMWHNGPMRDYALGTDEKSVSVRRAWDGDGDALPCNACDVKSLPGFAKRTLNYLSSLAEHVASGSQLVSLEEKNHRRKKCDRCSLRVVALDACSLCGCPLHETALGDKLSWKVSRCFNWERQGLAIGCYNMPKLAELQILALLDKCGVMPILLCDDTKPGTERQLATAALAKKYPNVEYWGNPENYGHHRGDASVFWKAIQWGRNRSLDVVCKQSMRHLVLKENWLQDSSRDFLASDHATGGVNCIDNDTRLFIRSECVLLNISKWFNSGAYKELQGRKSYAPVVELHYNHLMCQYFGVMQWEDEKGKCEIGTRWIWPLLDERRNNRRENIIWHCANGENEYRELAKRYGIELEEDFHTGGSETRRGFARDYKIG